MSAIIRGRVVADLRKLHSDDLDAGRRVRTELWRVAAGAPDGAELLLRVAAGQVPHTPEGLDLGRLHVTVESSDARTVRAWLDHLRGA